MADERGARSQGDSLVRAIGTLGLAAAIVNITIGGGIFRLPAVVAASLGAAAPLAYLVCAAAMGLIVLCIADAGSRVRLTGGPYAYIGQAFGPYAGSLAGVLLWVTGSFATAAVATVFASGVGLLAPALGGSVGEALTLAAVFGFWTLVNVRGVGLGARINIVATAAKLLPLLLVLIGGAFAVSANNLRVAAVPPAADVARMSLLLIFAFAGIESALVPSGEVRDTARTVPRAIALAMGGITLLYIGLQVVAQGVLGPALAEATVAPLADVAGASMGPWAHSLLLIGASISMFGYLGGMTLSMPRMLFALAQDGFLPRVFTGLHPVHRSPHLAIAAQSALAVTLAVTGTFETLAIMANAALLTIYLGCALASWQLRRLGIEGDGTGTAFRMPLGAVTPWLACGVIVWLLTGLTRGEWFGFAVCVAAASLPYAYAASRK